ncbi:MAG: hypothetical protein JXB32_13845 [Deltaproteobacteria bacterium]|nr:hypothetical protein [Deltaproteobacteria bacterium]
MKQASFFVALALAATTAGCDDDTSTAGCVHLCTEAQAGHCTVITGDCTAFCNALDGVQGPSGCADEREAYQGCLNRGATACDNDCGSQESALSTCVGLYCLANPTNADCTVLSASF